MHQQVKTLLKSHQLRSTKCREDVISMFLQNTYAISHADLEEQLVAYDRVTLYRTINTFLEKGIIHQVLDDIGQNKYALCKEGCDTHQHNDEHVHFKCLKCGQMQCIASIENPKIDLPKGFTYTDSIFIIRGTCNSC